LEALSQNVGSLEQNLKTTQSTLMETEGSLKQKETALMQQETELKQQDEELAIRSRQVRFQRAMDQAVEEFPDDEAAVYQQGSKLIFRLKKINFASGSAIIPAESKPMLAKINDMIKLVNAELVAVEGHTDSIGSASLNKTLSTKRAIAVANYLAALVGTR
jgi:outer membrane protein OmpA-like peptidoglycan-associated protein